MAFPQLLKIEFSNTDMDSLTHALHRIADSMPQANLLADAFADNIGFSFEDEVALRVIQSMLARPDQTGMTPSFIAKHAYSIADEALKERDARLFERQIKW